jgi:drug/metabolite transporter (DMT)-like permease
MLSGVLVALGAAAAFEISYVLQALEARDESADHGLRLALLLRLIRNPRWAAATALTAGGAALQLWALTLAPVTVVQPTLAVGLLALPLLSRFVLHEHLRAHELLAIAAIVGGVTVIAAFGPTHVGRQAAGIELGIELALLVAVLLAPFALRSRGGPPQLAVLGAAAGDAAAAIGLKLAADELHNGRIGYAALWGALGAVCGAMALTAEMTALQRLRANQIAPVVVGCQVLVPVATGLAFLGDSWRHTPGGGALLAVAVAVVVAGGAVLGASRTVEEALGVEPEHDLGGGGQPGE